MIRQVHEGAVYYTFQDLARHGVRHGVFTRLGGGSQPPFAELNVGHTVGDDGSTVDANHQLVYEALGLEENQVVTAHQVHGNRVVQVGERDGGRVIPAADGLISQRSGLTLMMRFADCMPVLLYDRRTGAVGLAHAGWRGTMADVAGETVRAMERDLGSDPADLIAALGPAIGICCYQVGQEVIQRTHETFPTSLVLLQKQGDGSYHFDLTEANTWQLRRAGVSRIEAAASCTACRVTEFYSHRAEAGQTGRFAVLIGR